MKSTELGDLLSKERRIYKWHVDSWLYEGATYLGKIHWKQSRSEREDDKFRLGDIEFKVTDIQR